MPAIENMGAIRERLSRLEAMIRVPQIDADESLWSQVETSLATLTLQREACATTQQRMEEMIFDVKLLKTVL